MVEDFGTASDPTADRAKAEWIVEAAAGSTLEITARHPRAGVARTTLTLG